MINYSDRIKQWMEYCKKIKKDEAIYEMEDGSFELRKYNKNSKDKVLMHGPPINKMKLISEINPCAIYADGFDDAILGYDINNLVCAYDYDKMINILMKRDKISYDDAVDILEYNTVYSYVGKYTPIYIQVLQ